MSKYPTLEALMSATAADLATISEEGAKRKVGKAVAERLYGLLKPPIKLSKEEV
jgi:hypothetical protein